jgi:hypothetical protein
VEARRRLGSSGAQIRENPRGDAENRTENGLLCVDTEAADRAGERIEYEAKSSAGRGRAWNETEREIKSSGGRNGLRDEADRGMKSEERRGANAIGQTRDALEQQK